MYDLELLELEALELECSAEWRRQKAQEYPEDAQRNLEAAELLDKLAVEIRALQGSDVHRNFSAAVVKRETDYTFHEAQSDYRRLIGFHEWPDNAEEYLIRLMMA
jgi:hypothetical protein